MDVLGPRNTHILHPRMLHPIGAVAMANDENTLNVSHLFHNPLTTTCSVVKLEAHHHQFETSVIGSHYSTSAASLAFWAKRLDLGVIGHFKSPPCLVILGLAELPSPS